MNYIWQILVSIVSNSIAILCKMSPYLLLGFLVAGILYVMIPQTLVEQYLGKGRRFRSVINATLLGIPLPLCSCSVIPVVTSLRERGASKGATISFLLSAPQTGIDSFMVTFGILGPVIAVFRVIAALVSGLAGGLLVELFGGAEKQEKNIDSPCEACCHSGKNQRKSEAVREALYYGLRFMPGELAVPVIGGTLIAGIITIIVPESLVEKYIGGGITGMLIAMVSGIPMYVCATGSVPIAGALLAKGASPGAAFVFLMVGPATNAATITVIWKLLGVRKAIIYLISLVAVAIGLGLVLNTLISVAGRADFIKTHCSNPSVIEQILCAGLIGIFAYGLLSKRKT